MEKKDPTMIIAVILILLVGVGSYFIFKQKGDNTPMNITSGQTEPTNDLTKPSQPSQPSQPTQPVENKSAKQWNTPPVMSLEKGKTYSAILKTSKGDIKVNLYADKTPITVNNFVFLANQGFYNATKFHRIIKGFMIQGGDPEGTGMGGPGYRFNDEPFDGDYSAGTIAMANAGPNTNGSQFFIMHKDYPLPKNYVIFGKVADQASMDVVNSIAETPVKASSTGEMSVPTQEVKVNSVEIVTQ